MTFPILGGNGAVGGYAIDNSLRFNDDDSAYLSRTISSTGSQTTASFSCWLKRSNLGNNGTFFSNKTSATGINSLNYRFNTSDQLVFSSGTTGDANYNVIPTQVLRDVSAWYHILAVTDTTESVEGDRFRVWINGVEVDDFSSFSMPSQNTNMRLSNSSYPHTIGEDPRDNTHFDGYLADVYFIDGTAKSPTDFGEFDEDSGIWKPIRYSGSYGTNGFYLDFENSGSLGADQSGNGNDFTPTNLASTDQTTDTPTNNFSTLNPLAKYPNNGILSEGNTTFVGINAGNEYYNTSTFAFAQGKWYSEFKLTADPDGMNIGIMKTDLFGSTSPHSTSSAWTFTRGTKRHNGTSTSYGSTPSTNDILMMAVDMDNGKIWWGLNGTFFNSGDPANGTNEAFSGISGEVYVLVNDDFSTRVPTCLCNFGNPSFSISSGNSDGNGYGNFEYAPPSGYLALCTQNLATALSPTIDDGSEYFNTVLYSGTGSSQGITGVGFQPDFTWIKIRNTVDAHGLVDSTRGATKHLRSDSTASEFTRATDVSSFDSDGFTVVSDAQFNGSGNTYASWNWLANGGTTSSNTDGSITSTVQANTTAGFSIVTWTGDGNDNASVGHGLGVTPEIIIIKNRDSAQGWVFNANLSSKIRMNLNTTNADLGDFTFYMGTQTSSNIVFGNNHPAWNASGDNMVAYVFHSVEGYSKMGLYTGNGSTDGAFVYTGFRPAFIIIKRTDSANSWTIRDSKRSTFNVMQKSLFADLSNAESDSSSYNFDFLSNGFKQRNSNGIDNASGGTYIYMAFAESPFVTSTSIPVVAR